MSTQGFLATAKSTATRLVTGETILAPSPEYERALKPAARNLRRKLVTGALAGLATLAIGWSLGALGVIKVACEVVGVVSLLVDFGVAYVWPSAEAE